MKILNSRNRIIDLIIILSLIAGKNVFAQGGASGASGNLKWMRIGSLQAYFSEQGAESETGSSLSEYHVTFSWPAEYGLNQATNRANGVFMGCVDFYEQSNGTTYDYYTVNNGPKPNEYTASPRPIFDAHEFKLVGKFYAPYVTVDDVESSAISLYDEIDSIDTNLGADRMLLIKNHSKMGVTITKKVYGFGQENNDNYFIIDYTLENTGIVEEDGTIYSQTIDSFYFATVKRYALAGESVSENGNWAGVTALSWGQNILNGVSGIDPTAPDFDIRSEFAFAGPHSGRSVTAPIDDWGLPRINITPEEIDMFGVMASAKWAGQATLHADESPTNTSDDSYQPKTTWVEDTDSPEGTMIRAPGNAHLNVGVMAARFNVLSRGHRPISWADDYFQQYPDYNGSVDQANGAPANNMAGIQSFGPYTLEPGDDVHIVVAYAVAGLNRNKNKEVTRNFLQYYLGTGSTPQLILPGGGSTTDASEYKRQWFFTCEDSLMQTFRNARDKWESGFVSEAPPPPETFSVKSGGDRISLTWAANAEDTPDFIGYDIYRAQSDVLNPETTYELLKQWRIGDDDMEKNSFDDLSPIRNFDYYYYIQAVAEVGGERFASGKMWTLTNAPATLQRPAGIGLEQVRVVPNPYDIRSRSLQFGESASQADRLAFNELPAFCKLKIFTERGDLVWSKEHINGTGDELWNQLTSSGQLVVSGIYILYVEVTADYQAPTDIYALWDITDPKSGKILFNEGDLVYSQGELMYEKGQSVFRKFVIIR